MVINKKITQLDNMKTEKDFRALISKQDVFMDPQPSTQGSENDAEEEEQRL